MVLETVPGGQPESAGLGNWWGWRPAAACPRAPMKVLRLPHQWMHSSSIQAWRLFPAGLKTPFALGMSSHFTLGEKSVLPGAITAETQGMRRGWHHVGRTLAAPAVHTFFFLSPAQGPLQGTGCSVLGAAQATGRARGSHMLVTGIAPSPQCSSLFYDDLPLGCPAS